MNDTPLTRDALAADLRSLFRSPGVMPRPPRRLVGAEAELIPVIADTGRVAPIQATEGPSSLELLRRHAARERWTERASPERTPLFLPPQGGVVSFEPGGQIEYSSLPYPSASALLHALGEVITPLRAAAEDEGICLLGVGIDPRNTLEDSPLQLRAPRYVRMADYLADLGPAGARMMRQTAALHLNLDHGRAPRLRWRVLNALAPYLAAIFANSSIYAGAPCQVASQRALTWRELDPLRTGILAGGRNPASEYLDFALRAPAILHPARNGSALPFAQLARTGQAGLDDWHVHLTTLFPEVRPKSFLEIRSIDAIDPVWYAAPVVFLTGLIYHSPTLLAANDLLGRPDPANLQAAAQLGLADPDIATVSRDLVQLALRGATQLGPPFLEHDDIETARHFFERYALAGRCPGSDALTEALRAAG